MSEWLKLIQTVAESIDEAIRAGRDEDLTLEHLAARLGYSPYHTTRMFRSLSGLSLREYLRQRRLAYALVAVRDSDANLLDIALGHGFSSHEAFTRAFKQLYGRSPAAYRADPVPVVLRTRLTPFDRYIVGHQAGAFQQGGFVMSETNGSVKIYFVRIPAHKFLHIKNYESHGYFDFWEKQGQIPGQDCDTICGLLDSIKGKLDGDDAVIGSYSGQIMGYPQEADGRCPEAYGARLPADYTGPVPEQMQLLDVAEGDYIVFEHSPFDYETECVTAYQKVDAAVAGYDYTAGEFIPDETPGRIGYYYNDPSRFLKFVKPVCKG